MNKKNWVALSLIFESSLCLAWGQYGHEQVNSAALELIKNTPLGACLSRPSNRDTILRLSVTPDLDWKMSSWDRRALGIYKLPETYPTHPDDGNLLKKVAKIIKAERKKKDKSRVLSDKFLDDLSKNPSNKALLESLRDQEKAAGKLGDLEPDVLEKESKNDFTEHSLHFFEIDTYYNPKSVTSSVISSFDGDFDQTVLSFEKKKMRENLAYIESVDKCKTESSTRGVILHGTAPWRIQSLFKLAKKTLEEALKEKNPQKFDLAIYYLGTMGHYVGDMGQPLHATMKFNGDHTHPESLGVHSSFESYILDSFAKHGYLDSSTLDNDGHKHRNKVFDRQSKSTHLWANFDQTQPDVLQFAQKYGSKTSGDLSDDKVVRQVIQLIVDGYSFVDPIIKSYGQTRAAVENLEQLELPLPDCNPTQETRTKKPKTPVIQAFKNAGAQSLSMITIAEKRMGEAASVLAQLWRSIADSAGYTGSSGLCPDLHFDRAQAVLNYPIPDHHVPLSDFADEKYRQTQATVDQEDGDDDDESDETDSPGLFDDQRNPDSVKEKTRKK